MEADGGVWDDFGQKVDLTARLREILINYPEGTSILKELVQNAVRGERTVLLLVTRAERARRARVPRRRSRDPPSLVSATSPERSP